MGGLLICFQLLQKHEAMATFEELQKSQSAIFDVDRESHCERIGTPTRGGCEEKGLCFI